MQSKITKSNKSDEVLKLKAKGYQLIAATGGKTSCC